MKVPDLPVSFKFCPARVRRATGEVVPTPMLPVLLTTNWVREEEPTTKPGTLVPRPFGLTDSNAHGVLVPTPTAPTNVEADEVVESKFPTVSWEVVAMSDSPSADEVMMELVENLVTPVPPYNTPTEEVAETTPALAWRGPFNPAKRLSVPMLVVVDEAVVNDP